VTTSTREDVRTGVVLVGMPMMGPIVLRRITTRDMKATTGRIATSVRSPVRIGQRNVTSRGVMTTLIPSMTPKGAS
jgi:hypothetical protein